MKDIVRESWNCLECSKNCMITLFGNTAEGSRILQGSIGSDNKEWIRHTCFIRSEHFSYWKLLHRQIGE
jgi:hypothetical protein